MPDPKNPFEKWVYDYAYKKGHIYGVLLANAIPVAALYPFWDWLVEAINPENAVALGVVASIALTLIIPRWTSSWLATSMLRDAHNDPYFPKYHTPPKPEPPPKMPPLHLAAGRFHRVVLDVEKRKLTVLNRHKHTEIDAPEEIFRRFNEMRIRALAMYELTEAQYLTALERAAQAACLALEEAEPAMSNFFGMHPDELMDRIIDDLRKHGWIWHW